MTPTTSRGRLATAFFLMLALLPIWSLAPAALLPSAVVAALCIWGWVRYAPQSWTGPLAVALLTLASTFVFAFAAAWDRPFAGLVVALPFGLVAVLDRVLRDKARRVLGFAPLLTAVVMALVVVVTWWGYAKGSAIPRLHDDFLYRLRADVVPAGLDGEARSAAVRVVRATVRGETIDPTTLPASLRDERAYPLWVTLFRDGRRSTRARGEAPPGPLHTQLVAATRAAWTVAKPEVEWAAARDSLRIQVDVGGPPRTLGFRAIRRLADDIQARLSPKPKSKKDAASTQRWSTLVYDAEPGLDGYILEGEGRRAVTLPSDPIIEGWYSPGDKTARMRTVYVDILFRELRRRAGFAPGTSWPEDANLSTFATYAFAATDASNDSTHELYRANVLGPKVLDDAGLVDAIGKAGRWLLEQVEDDGRFDYEYLPVTDDHGRDYNEVRHAGSVYGLFHMVHVTLREPSLRADRDAYLEAGLRALDRVYRNLGPPPGEPADSPFVTFREGKDGVKSNSGGPALTLLSFLERPTVDEVADSPLAPTVVRADDERIMLGLALTLEAMIDEKGAVYQLWTEAKAGKGVEKEPLYFPGEVMLALARFHQRTGDPRWLAASKRIADRQIGLLSRPWTNPDHWVMQALDILDQIEPNEPKWRAAGYEMAGRYMREQYPPQVPPFLDYQGGYRRQIEVPRTTRAASRGEALGGISRIAWRHGEPSADLEQALIEGGRHLVEQMFDEQNSYFLPNRPEALGCIRMGIIDMHCRIDNNQHAIVALDNALAALRRRAGATE